MTAGRVVRRWSWLVGAAIAGAAATSIAGKLAPLGWPFELFAHFRWQLFVAGVVLLPVALILRRPWMIVAALVTVSLQWAPWRAADGSVTVGQPAACEGKTEISVATVNVWFRNGEHDRALEWLKANPADVVLVQEVTADWVAVLAKTKQQYPQQKFLPREDPYGIALLSRWPLDQVVAVDFAADGLPSVVARVNVQGRQVLIVGLHTHWPLLRDLQRSRDSVLLQAAAMSRLSSTPTVLLGDLNLTPYAPAFRRLLDRSGLKDAFASRAWRPTWQAGFWPLALPLDHVLVPQDSCVVSAQIGADIGSDHRPVLVRLRLD
jgi:endonuclease/exonuclease/phosphatase (EEP) superfamily protein YafD